MEIDREHTETEAESRPESRASSKSSSSAKSATTSVRSSSSGSSRSRSRSKRSRSSSSSGSSAAPSETTYTDYASTYKTDYTQPPVPARETNEEKAEKAQKLQRLKILQEGLDNAVVLSMEDPLYIIHNEVVRLETEIQMKEQVGWMKDVLKLGIDGVEKFARKPVIKNTLGVDLEGLGEANRLAMESKDYTIILMEIHEKWFSGSRLPPEVRLIGLIVGTMIAVHTTNCATKLSANMYAQMRPPPKRDIAPASHEADYFLEKMKNRKRPAPQSDDEDEDDVESDSGQSREERMHSLIKSFTGADD